MKENNIFAYTGVVRTVNIFKDIDEIKLVKIRDLKKSLNIETINITNQLEASHLLFNLIKNNNDAKNQFITYSYYKNNKEHIMTNLLEVINNNKFTNLFPTKEEVVMEATLCKGCLKLYRFSDEKKYCGQCLVRLKKFYDDSSKLNFDKIGIMKGILNTYEILYNYINDTDKHKLDTKFIQITLSILEYKIKECECNEI